MYLEKLPDGMVTFYCPGCKKSHLVDPNRKVLTSLPLCTRSDGEYHARNGVYCMNAFQCGRDIVNMEKI